MASQRQDSLNVAIVGAGPRGIAAVQTLASEVTGPLTIHLFGALDHAGNNVAGQGTPFAVDQDDFSRLNARSAIVDTFGPYRRTPTDVEESNPSSHNPPKRDEDDTADPTAVVGMNFDEWANETGQEQWENSFPPRSVIGEYFSYCIEFVRDNLPENISLLEYGRAQRVTGEPHRWIIATEHQDIVAEELLLAVGHAVTAPDALTSKDTEEIADRLFESAYPLDRLDDIPAGATVATRGAGLTFIDVALALTEGRGGSFNGDATTYTPSGNEVSVIYPTDLQGMFLDAKPPVEELDNLLDAECWELAEDEIAGADSLAEILDVIRELCADIFAELGISAPKGTYDDILKGPEPGQGLSRKKLAESIEVTKRERPFTARAAFACTVIRLLEELIGKLSGEEWPRSGWTTFTTINELVSNYGFGPPLMNAQKILTLIDAGIIDCSWLDSGVDALELPDRVDALIDAVLAPSGFWPGAYPELADIEQYLGIWADPEKKGARTGVRTDEDGTVVDDDVRPIHGLAAIGRITEGWVLGMDTLNTTVHPHMLNWAKRIARRAEDQPVN